MPIIETLSAAQALQTWNKLIDYLDTQLLIIFSTSELEEKDRRLLEAIKKAFDADYKVLLRVFRGDSRMIYIENEYEIIQTIFKTLKDYAPGVTGEHKYLKELIRELKQTRSLRNRL